MKHGKKYQEAAKLVDRSVQYDTAEAIALVKKTYFLLQTNASTG